MVLGTDSLPTDYFVTLLETDLVTDLAADFLADVDKVSVVAGYSASTAFSWVGSASAATGAGASTSISTASSYAGSGSATTSGALGGFN